jgi:flavin-dependent dehydrogenase
MKNYDIAIIGAGIAGTSLAYNLNQKCPELKTIIIDKKEPGANKDYGNRNTPYETAKENKLPYNHIYQGIKVGIEDEVLFKLQKKYAFINYQKTCKQFLKKSETEYKNEEAENIQGKFLTTNKNIYRTKLIIDCSGKSFFAKKILNQPKPERYWVGRTRIIKNTLKDKNYFYHQFSNTVYFEDLNPLKDKTLQGDWYYLKSPDFRNLYEPEKNILKKEIKNPKIIQEFNSIIPCTPSFPTVHKNILFLGDSFGNPTASSACGINIILKTSELLANCIKKRKISIFEKKWKEQYLEIYIRHLVSKFNSFHHSKLVEKIKNSPPRKKLYPIIAKYPEMFEGLMDGLKILEFPKEFQKMFPKRLKLFQAYYYLMLKLKYNSFN